MPPRWVSMDSKCHKPPGNQSKTKSWARGFASKQSPRAYARCVQGRTARANAIRRNQSFCFEGGKMWRAVRLRHRSQGGPCCESRSGTAPEANGRRILFLKNPRWSALHFPAPMVIRPVALAHGSPRVAQLTTRVKPEGLRSLQLSQGPPQSESVGKTSVSFFCHVHTVMPARYLGSQQRQ